MTAGFAIVICVVLGIAGGLFSWRGIGADTQIEFLSIKWKGGLGPLMIVLCIGGFILTTWWQWPAPSSPDVVVDDEQEYEDWLSGEVEWCDENFDSDPDYCTSIYTDAFG